MQLNALVTIDADSVAKEMGSKWKKIRALRPQKTLELTANDKSRWCCRVSTFCTSFVTGGISPLPRPQSPLRDKTSQTIQESGNLDHFEHHYN